MAQMTVGLDLGHESIKRVRLRSSFRTVEVVDFCVVPVAQDARSRQARLAEALSQLDGGGHGDLLATALPGDEVSIRPITLPFSDRKRIAQTIGFELESLIPFSLDKVVFEYLVAGDAPEGGSRLLVALCQIELLSSWLDTLGQADLDPRLIGPESMSYSSLFDMLPVSDDPDASVAILDIGKRLSSLCVMGPKGVEFARTLSGGGHQVTSQLAETFKVDHDRAEEGKCRGSFVECAGNTAATPEQVLISDAVRRATATLIRELRQTLSAHQTLTRRRVSKIWLCGGGAAIRNLDGYLSQELGLQAEVIRAEHFDLPGMEHLQQQDEASSSWVKALGLALQAHQGGRRGFLNLRKGPLAFKGDFAVMHGKVVHLAAAVLITIFLAIGLATTHYLSLSSTEKAINKRMKEVTQAILGKPYDDLEVAMSIMEEKISPETNPLPSVSAVDVLREMHKRVPEKTKMRMKDLSISPKRIQLSAFTDSFESVEKIRTALEKYDCFKEIQTGKTQKTADGAEVEFRFTIAFGC
jgi:general secretion pathway protein L